MLQLLDVLMPPSITKRIEERTEPKKDLPKKEAQQEVQQTKKEAKKQAKAEKKQARKQAKEAKKQAKQAKSKASATNDTQHLTTYTEVAPPSPQPTSMAPGSSMSVITVVLLLAVCMAFTLRLRTHK